MSSLMRDSEVSLGDLAVIRLVANEHMSLEYFDDVKNENDADMFQCRSRSAPLQQVLVIEFHELDGGQVDGLSQKLHSSGGFGKMKKKQRSVVNTKLMAGIARATDKYTELIKVFSAKHSTLSDDDILNMALPLLPVDPCSQKNPKHEPIEEGIQTLEDAVDAILRKTSYSNQIIHRLSVPEREPKYAKQVLHLSVQVEQALSTVYGVAMDRLYSHQFQAIKALLEDTSSSVIVATSTSSGKSIIFNASVTEALVGELSSRRPVTALYLFPTKALSQDQLFKLRDFLDAAGLEHVKVSTFDGDTPFEMRDDIRLNSRMILTNPDILHVTLLPNHHLWRHFFENLRFVIIDEVHMYSGYLGAHVAMLMRRLKRVVSLYQTEPRVQFIACSATIMNPKEHACALMDLSESQLKVITEDGSPQASKEILIWAPVLSSDLLSDTATLIKHFTQHQFRTIAFCKIRSMCELLMKEFKQLSDSDKVKAYRGGYPAPLRRTIEGELFSGKLMGVVSTTALELGIDIGDLDVTLHLGFPYSMAGFWQQAGRAGRRKSKSLAVFIVDKDPLDLYYANHPELLLERVFERVTCDFAGTPIYDQHLQCAAKESPLVPGRDEKWFGDALSDACTRNLWKMGYLFHPSPKFTPNPAKHFPIRCIEQESLQIIDMETQAILEEVEISRALYHVFEGAVHFFEGCSYIILKADFQEKRALARRCDVNYITRQRDYTDVDGMKSSWTRQHNGASLSLGEVRIKMTVYGYFKYDPKKQKIIETVDVYAEPVELWTKGVWIDLSHYCVSEFHDREDLSIEAGIHGACHAITNIIPRRIICNATEIGTEHKSQYQKRTRPNRLIFYDRHAGATGLPKSMYDDFDGILNEAYKTVAGCECVDGCPSCCFSPYCCEFNEVVCKNSALLILSHLIGLH